MQLEGKGDEEQLQIPKTIQQHKMEGLKAKLISTISGIQYESLFKTSTFLFLLIVISSFVILKFVPSVPYGACVGINIGVCFVVSILYDHTNSVPPLVHKYIISAIFGYLWSHQLYYSSGSQLIVLTFISIILSIGPIVFQPVQQINSSTLYTGQFNIHSTRYVRLILPLPLFIIQLIWDYGRFFGQSTNHLYYIRLTISLVFLTWVFGWISTIYNTYYFIVNNINRFLFGDEAKANLPFAFATLICNCIPIAIYLGWAQNWQNTPIWILWIGSSITAFVTFSIEFLFNKKFKMQSIGSRNICMIIQQACICGGLVALLLCIDFSSLDSSIKIITVIDVAIYALIQIIRFLYLPRNVLGISFNLNALNNQYFRWFQRTILRIVSGFTVIILIQNLKIIQLWTKLYQTLDIHIDAKFVQYFFVPFLAYRSYKRSLSSCTTFSFHFSVLISLGLIYINRDLQAILVVLFFPPFPNHFTMAYLAPFTTPKKLLHNNQCCYRILYLCITMMSTLVLVLSIGMLQFTMVFGLPVFICVLPTINEGNQIKSKQHSLYEKIVQYIPMELFKFQKQGFYLLRISKYILLAQVKQQCYGFAEVIDLKGLQVQQVTSCHSKEGQTIDRMVEQTWGDNKQCLNFSHLWTVLSPLKKSVIHAPTQNQIQLTGIIQSQQFIQLFKSATLKALVHQISRISYSQKQLNQGEQIVGDLNPICKKQKFQKLFPIQFSKKVGLQVQFPQTSTTKNIVIKKKLPPIKGKPQVVNDFLDLLDNSPKLSSGMKGETSTNQLNPISKQQKDQVINENQKKNVQASSKVDSKQLNVALIMSLYHYSIGKFDYLNIKKVFDLINLQKGEISQVTFQNAQKIISNALSKAFKISIDKTTMGQTQIELEDFQGYQKDAYLGIAGSQGFNDAVARDLQDIWTLNYAKGKLSIKRLSKSQNDLYMFQADSSIVRATWNNLRFQLLYATNDNDQRYSIQTQPSLMRNLWTQACEQPFGYPGYHSGNFINN